MQNSPSNSPQASNQQLVSASKFLSLILRHAPETIGLTLDAAGWAPLDALVRLAGEHGKRLDLALIRRVVASSDKQRYAISDDGLRIRANQGHSVAVDLQLEPQTPPPVLFHGTATRFLEPILVQGLRAQSRQHVHLSADVATATSVGARHGKPTVLTVDAAGMLGAGHVFFRSQNGVWLTAAVPPEFLQPCAAG